MIVNLHNVAIPFCRLILINFSFAASKSMMLSASVPEKCRRNAIACSYTFGFLDLKKVSRRHSNDAGISTAYGKERNIGARVSPPNLRPTCAFTAHFFACLSCVAEICAHMRKSLKIAQTIEASYRLHSMNNVCFTQNETKKQSYKKNILSRSNVMWFREMRECQLVKNLTSQ